MITGELGTFISFSAMAVVYTEMSVGRLISEILVDGEAILVGFVFICICGGDWIFVNELTSWQMGDIAMMGDEDADAEG